MEPPYNKVQLLLLMSTLLLFGLLHLQHLLFCCNATLSLVYNTVPSQLCHYHKSLWKAESHSSFGHVGSNSHVISVCKNFVLFFNPKMLQHFSLLGWGKNSCGSRLLKLTVLLFFTHFLNSSSANAVDMKMLSAVTPLQETKEDSTMSIIIIFAWITSVYHQ